MPCIGRIGFPGDAEHGVLSPKVVPAAPSIRAHGHQGGIGNRPRCSECVIARAPSLRSNFVTMEARSHHVLLEIYRGSKPSDSSGCIASGNDFGWVLSVSGLPVQRIRLLLSQWLPGQLRLQLFRRLLCWLSEDFLQLERISPVLFLRLQWHFQRLPTGPPEAADADLPARFVSTHSFLFNPLTSVGLTKPPTASMAFPRTLKGPALSSSMHAKTAVPTVSLP